MANICVIKEIIITSVNDLVFIIYYIFSEEINFMFFFCVFFFFFFYVPRNVNAMGLVQILSW